MAALSISRAWDETKDTVASDGRLMMIVAAALLLLPQALIATIAPPEQLSGVEVSGAAGLLPFVAGLIGIVGQIAIIRLALVRSISVGEAVTHGLKRFLPVLAAVLLVLLAMCVILIPLMMVLGVGSGISVENPEVMPRAALMAAGLIAVFAILIAPLFLMMMPVATAEAGGPIHILKRSWGLGASHYIRLLAFMLLILVTAFIIVLATEFIAGSALRILFGDLEPLSFGALLYGLLFGALQAAFAVVMSVMLARIYVQLSGREGIDVSVPKSGT